MPLVKDRVKQTTTSTGTGSVALSGAVAGFQTFAQAFSSGAVVYYCIADGSNWEVGIGTYTSGSPGSLSRDSVLASSNNGAAVSWGVGTKDVFVTIPATVINNAAGLICIEKTASGPLVKSQSFIANSASRLSFPLPATAAVGDRFEVIGKGAGGWQIVQAAGQTIRYGSRTTSASANDGIMSANRYDTVELVCIVANTEFVVVDATGQPAVLGEQGYNLTNHTAGQYTPTAYPTNWISGYSMVSNTLRSVGTLVSAVFASCAVCDANTAWTIGGATQAWSAATNIVTRFPFATETSATTSSVSAIGNYSSGLGVNSSAAINKGFRMRVYTPDLSNAWNNVEKIAYTTEAVAQSSASAASNGLERAGAMKTGALSYVYCPDRSNNIMKFDNSTEVMTFDYRNPDNYSSEGSTYGQSTSTGYRMGGVSGTVNAFTFSSESAATIAATTHTMVFSGNYNNATKLFSVGGHVNGSWTGTTSVRSLSFPTNTVTAEAALTNSFGRYNANSVQNGGYY